MIILTIFIGKNEIFGKNDQNLAKKQRFLNGL
jgi:hypothetical protein